ncbi:hypothetical protein [Streptomyces hygroscopicus]|uniref:hypothetical protein n=1 Tax=Streptomyces hygroscopicus TaxID=1912 RepID=UPI001FCB93CC|nr:hypothetical protein [Streptomyces hygroscopicus]BDH14218.1 hypothetical protein HOK021_53970 [Streptomyces hygroscopicus]
MTPEYGPYSVLYDGHQVRLAQIRGDQHHLLVATAYQAPQLGRGELIEPVDECDGYPGYI